MTKEEIMEDLKSCANDEERRKRYQYLQKELSPENNGGDVSLFTDLLSVWEEFRHRAEESAHAAKAKHEESADIPKGHPHGGYSNIGFKTDVHTKRSPKETCPLGHKKSPTSSITQKKDWTKVKGFNKTFWFEFFKKSDPKHGYTLKLNHRVEHKQFREITKEVELRGGCYNHAVKAWFLPEWPDTGLAKALK